MDFDRASVTKKAQQGVQDMITVPMMTSTEGQDKQHNHNLSISFSSWLDGVTQSSRELIPVVLLMFFLAFMTEGLKAAQRRLRRRPLFWIRSRKTTVVLHNLMSMVVHSVTMATMFFLMVVFMFLEPWMCSGILLGGAVGHVVFHWYSVWDSEYSDKGDGVWSQW